MAISPEMARQELARRQSLGNKGQSITAEMARAELERRQSLTKTQPEVEEEGMLSRAGRSLARIPRNAIAGALDVGDFIATPVREGLNLGAKALGLRQIPTLAGETTKAIDTLSGGFTAPQTKGEKTEEAMQRAIFSLPVGGALGQTAKGMKYAPELLKSAGNFLQGSNVLTPSNIAATGATSGAIQHSMNQNPEDVAGALLSGAGAGLGVSALPSIAGLLTKRGRAGIGTSNAMRIGEGLDINPEAIESFKSAGISPTLADISKSDRVKMAQSAVEKVPYAGTTIQKARDLQKKQILEGLRQGESELSKAEASQLVKKGAQQYQDVKQKGFSGTFEKVEQDINRLKDDTIGIDNVDKFFEPIFKNFKTKSQENRFLKSPLGKEYKDLYETAVQNKGRIPYHDAKDRLDHINDMITTHGQIGKVSQGKLKGFAGVIAKDIEESLEPKFKDLGGDSLKNWKDAKKLYSEYAQHDIPKLNELYKKDKKGATDAFIDLVTNQKRGAEKAKIVLNGLNPKDQIDLTDSIHKQLGATSDGTFSALKWVRGYKSLDKDAKNILLSPLDSSSQKRIKSIADTVDHMKSALNEANSSKTAYYQTMSQLATKAGAAGYSLASGNIIPVASLAAGLFLTKLGSEKLLTNPKFINWLDKGMKAKNIDHFQKILSHPPKVGSLNKILHKEIQTFQHDLKLGENTENKQKKEKSKSGMIIETIPALPT